MPKKSLAIRAVIGASLFVILLFHYDDIVGFLRPQPDFKISVNPKWIVLSGFKGSSNRTVITVSSVNGLSANITLKVRRGLGFVGNVRFTFDPPSVDLVANGQISCILKLDVVSPIPPGKYYIDVIGIADNLEHSVRIVISVSS